MVSYIQAKTGDPRPARNTSLMQNLQRSETNIRNIAIAPDNRIQLCGADRRQRIRDRFYYPDNPSQWPAVEKIIKQKNPPSLGHLISGNREAQV